MKVMHLNCGTMHPPGGRLINEKRARVVCHCLLLEADSGLILVDTGVGMRDMEKPARLGPLHLVMNIKLDPDATAFMQMKSLGYDPADVTHIIMTHLDLDHAGGLPDFPGARVHLLKREHDAAMKPKTFRERERYRRCHFAHSPRWVLHDEISNEDWYGLKCMRSLEGLPESIILVPLIGHTRGHCGVAIENDGNWLLHAGDTYYFHGQMDEKPSCTPGFRLFQWLSHLGHAAAIRRLQKVHRIVLENPDKIETLCTHDPLEFDRYGVNPSGQDGGMT